MNGYSAKKAETSIEEKTTKTDIYTQIIYFTTPQVLLLLLFFVSGNIF